MGKFKIPSVPPTINKTVRFPTDVVEQVEKAIQGKDCTFSAFVIAAVRMALENIEEKQGRFTCRPQISHKTHGVSLTAPLPLRGSCHFEKMTEGVRFLI